MRFGLTVIILFILSPASFAQIEINAGMGLTYTSSNSLYNYINANFSPRERLGGFNTGIEFSAEGGYYLNPSFEIGLEYALGIYSYNTIFAGFGNYDLSYNQHKPSIVAYYIIPGNGYRFKFGGGVGLRYLSLTEKIPTWTTDDYSSLGFGIVAKADGHTALSKNLFAIIGVISRFDFPGVPKNDSRSLSYGDKREVNINSVTFGIRLGISYYFF